MRSCPAQRQAAESWQKSLLTLTWAMVAEVSVNALLSLISVDATIQPMPRMIVSIHNRDEYAHSSIIVEASRRMFRKLRVKEQRFMLDWLPGALDAFVSHDYSAWEQILPALGLPGWQAMLDECRGGSRGGRLVRDFSGLRDLCTGLGLGLGEEMAGAFSDENCVAIGLGDLDLAEYGWAAARGGVSENEQD